MIGKETDEHDAATWQDHTADDEPRYDWRGEAMAELIATLGLVKRGEVEL